MKYNENGLRVKKFDNKNKKIVVEEEKKKKHLNRVKSYLS